MRILIRGFVAWFFCLAATWGAVRWLTSSDPAAGRRAVRTRAADGQSQAGGGGSGPARAGAEQDSPAEFHVVPSEFEDGRFGTASRFTAPIRDPGSLQELREAVRGRGRRGIEATRAS